MSKNPNLKRAMKIKGWSSRPKLHVLAQLCRHSRQIIEVGTYRGRSARAFFDNAPPAMKMIVVDAWAYNERGIQITSRDKQAFMSNLKDVMPRIDIYHHFSHEAADMIETAYGLRFADLVYIDGGHDYETVKRDIALYKRFVKPTGILCGDDYHKNWPGVVQAVNEAFGKPTVKSTIWHVRI
jgi:predicted O-methyltransferase YrrM